MYAHDDESDPLVGQVADGFVVLKRIGSGASSVVYQAMERAKDSRLVAVKVIDGAEQRLLAAAGQTGNPFEREARFSRVVKDPAIVRIFKTGRLGDGRYYVAMEWVKGMTLEEELHHRKAIPWREASELIRLTADAVASLHSIDIIHRDLKPGNLMVRTSKDGKVRVKLIDFGIAKLSHERDDIGAGVDPASIGTAGYVAPEVAAGGGTERRSDVYALGAMLYQCIVGRPVIGLERPSREGIVEYLASEAPIPSTPMQPSDDLPEALVELVHRCLSRDPLRRPADANSVAEELGAIIAEAGPEKSPSAFDKLGKAFRGLFGRRPRGGGKFAAK